MKMQIKSQMLSFATEAPPSPLFILGTYDSPFTNLAIDMSESASLLPGRTVAPLRRFVIHRGKAAGYRWREDP